MEALWSTGWILTCIIIFFAFVFIAPLMIWSHCRKMNQTLDSIRDELTKILVIKRREHMDEMVDIECGVCGNTFSTPYEIEKASCPTCSNREKTFPES